MTNSDPQASVNQIAAPALAEALEKNQEAAQAVQEAADDLAVVHAVLDSSKASAEVLHDDAKKAIDETAKVEQRLSEAVEKLEEVNQTLQRQMGKQGA